MKELAEYFTSDQKAAALTALKWIGMWTSMDVSDSESLQTQCAERLSLNFKLLGFNSYDPLLLKYEDENAEDLLFSTLNSIPEITKPWFVVETYMMVSSLGEISPRAMQIALIYCSKIGIEEHQYLKIIKEAYQATGDYNKGMFDI